MKNQLFDLTKKVSLITGGNGGIGLGMAKVLLLVALILLLSEEI